MKKKRYSRRKRIIIAYTLRTIVFLVLAGMVFLMICGCIHIYDFFRQRKEAQVSNSYEAGENKDGLWQETMDKLQAEIGEGYTIVLDAGHGGDDGGTSSGEVIEEDITLAVVLCMKELLEEEGVQVILTRDSDEFLSLEDRTDVANRSGADLFVSIHCNYYEDDSSVKGLECYYYEDSEAGQYYAEKIINELEQSEDITVRNAKEEEFYVLKNTRIPAVLIELGYLSNTGECRMLASEEYQETLALELVNAILYE